ncbi:modulator of macroautophagy TMEM150B isoform X4 [Macaca mulatta]
MPALLPRAHPAPPPGLRAPGSLERPETEAAPREQADLRPSLLGTRVAHPAPVPGLRAPGSLERARHVGLPVADAHLPSCLGYLWRLDRFCHCSNQQDGGPQQRLSLHQHLRILPPSELHLQPAAWICIVRYHQLRDWGVGRWPNQLILWTGLLCALGTSVVGNFQEKNQRPTHLAGAFLAFILGNVYFWLQLLLRRLKNLPQPGAPWIGPLRLGLCSFCTILIVAMIVLHACSLRSVSAACEWAVAMLLFALFGLFAVDFSVLESCTLCVQPWPSLSPPPASPISLPVQL